MNYASTKTILATLFIFSFFIQSCSRSYCTCHNSSGVKTRTFTIAETKFEEAYRECQAYSSATEDCTLGKN